MSWGAVAGAAIGAAGSIFGGKEEAKGYGAAAEALGTLTPVAEEIREAGKTEAANARSRLGEAGGQTQSGLQDFEQQLSGELSGTQALQDDVTSQLRDVIGGNFETTPGYEFMRSEALRGTGREMAARGMNVSGNVLTALQDRASGLASSEYSNIIGNLQGLLSTSGQLTGQGRGQRANLQQTGAGIYSDLFRTGEGISSDMLRQGSEQYGNMITDATVGRAEAGIGASQAKASGLSSALSGLGTAVSLFGND